MALKFYDFTIMIEAEDVPADGFYAYSPQLPGCYSNGRTVEEARRNMREAIEQHIQVLLEHNEAIPQTGLPVFAEAISIGVPA
jgi:predicted RNase H-like HicB family nuclease